MSQKQFISKDDRNTERNEYGLTEAQTGMIYYVTSTIKYARANMDIIRQRDPQLANKLAKSRMTGWFLNPFTFFKNESLRWIVFAAHNLAIELDEVIPPRPYWIKRVKKLENELGVKYTGPWKYNRDLSAWCHSIKKLRESNSDKRIRYKRAA